MKTKSIAILLMGLLLLLTGCSRQKPVEGGLYYTPAKGGGYSVLKILKLDDVGVHVRLYSNHFADPPKDIDETKLFMAGMDRKPGETLGMGHSAIYKKTFDNWHATFIQKSTVKDDELKGYRTWKETGGGYY